MDQDYGSIVPLCSWLITLALALSSAEVFCQQPPKPQGSAGNPQNYKPALQRQTDKENEFMYILAKLVRERFLVFDFVTMLQF